MAGRFFRPNRQAEFNQRSPFYQRRRNDFRTFIRFRDSEPAPVVEKDKNRIPQNTITTQQDQTVEANRGTYSVVT